MKKSIGKKKREKQRQEEMIQRIEELAVISNSWFDGEWFPCLKPKHHTDFMEFDRSICDLGLKRYIRQEMDGDFPSLSEDKQKFGVLVSEVVPGFRARMPVFNED